MFYLVWLVIKVLIRLLGHLALGGYRFPCYSGFGEFIAMAGDAQLPNTQRCEQVACQHQTHQYLPLAVQMGGPRQQECRPREDGIAGIGPQQQPRVSAQLGLGIKVRVAGPAQNNKRGGKKGDEEVFQFNRLDHGFAYCASCLSGVPVMFRYRAAMRSVWVIMPASLPRASTMGT